MGLLLFRTVSVQVGSMFNRGGVTVFQVLSMRLGLS